MSTGMRESYFTCDGSALYYIGQDREIHSENMADLLSLYGTDRQEFEKFLAGINDGHVGLCAPGEYLCVDTDSDECSTFRHIPILVFKKLIKDPDTIRLQYKHDNVILLQYNPVIIGI